MTLVKSILFGVAVGDALGVPVEFSTRQRLKAIPVTGMSGYGTHDQPPGTWSDDTSLTLCTAQALLSETFMTDVVENCLKWQREGHWTAHGNVFDIGGTTEASLNRAWRARNNSSAKFSDFGGTREEDNGNGSLMRILPVMLLFLGTGAKLEAKYSITTILSSITHAHPRSIVCCFLYLEFAILLYHVRDGVQPTYDCFLQLMKFDFYDCIPQIDSKEYRMLNELLKRDLRTVSEDEIKGDGYVVNSLEASLWCLVNSSSYEEAVLKAVNLGEDTDTTAAITGGLAGIAYGYESIPEEWLSVLARRKDIEVLAEEIEKKFLG